MGTDPCHWGHWQSLLWQYVNSNHDDGNIGPQTSVFSGLSRPAAAFPSYSNGFGFGVYGDKPTGVAAPTSTGRSSAVHPHLYPSNPPPEAVATAVAERRFLIFDQSGNGTSILFSSVGPPALNSSLSCPKPGLANIYGTAEQNTSGKSAPVNLSGGTEVSGGIECDEMREDTDEINALLYSDSEFEENAHAEEEDEVSSSQLPQGPTESAEEVGSNSMTSPPAKRRRRTEEEEEAIDLSLTDTASSARASSRREDGGDEASSDMGTATVVEEQERPRTGAAGGGLKRPRVQGTLSVLRKIIPGGKDMDDGAVLDEAIRYLRSIRLKARALGNQLK